MKRKIFFLLFSSPLILNAQESYKIQGFAIDSANQTPVDYANIGIEGKNLGTVSNDSGIFELNISRTFLEDSLTFSRIGYASKKMGIKELVLMENVEIKLVPKSTKIKEAEIVSRKLKQRKKGNKVKKSVIKC